MTTKPRKRRLNKAELAQRRRECFELRLTGASYPQIAEAMNLAQSTVHKHVQKVLEEAAAADIDKTLKYRELNAQRLDRLLFGVWARASAGHPAAVREARKLIDAQVRLLGLAAPLKIAHTDPTGEKERAQTTWVLPMPPDLSMEEWTQQTQAMLKDRQEEAERMVDELLTRASSTS